MEKGDGEIAGHLAMTFSKVMRLIALGIAGIFVLAIAFIEIDMDIGFEGHLSPELRIWTLVHSVALILTVRFGSFRYLIATWALYIGMNYALWSYLFLGAEYHFATLPAYWYGLGALAMVGFVVSLVADTTANPLGSK